MRALVGGGGIITFHTAQHLTSCTQGGGGDEGDDDEGDEGDDEGE